MCTASYQVQLISAKSGLKVLASKAVGASKKKKKMMMMKEVKFSSFDNRRFATLPIGNVI